MYGTFDKVDFFNEWLSSNPPNKDKALLAREFLLKLQTDSLEPTQEELNQGLNKLLSTNSFNEKEISPYRVSSSKSKNIRLGIAAAVTLLIGIFSIYTIITSQKQSVTPSNISYITKQTTYGQKSTITLPDGSKVKLNAGTKIIFPDNFQENRQISLTGEAFFDVKRDTLHPFIISTEGITITVLGTSFNVSAYLNEEEIDVAVESGSVKVSNNTNNPDPTFLKPTEMFIYNKVENDATKRIFDPLEIAWKDSVLYFEDADFSEVMIELERWYGLKVNVPRADIEKIPKNINGIFKNKSLEKVLSGLHYSLGIEYNIDYKSNTIFITKE